MSEENWDCEENWDWFEVEKLQAENARIKAEVERLSEIVQTAHADLFSENARLKSEVERLRKAGDALITALDKPDHIFDNSDKLDAINAWNAAKEGKQP